MVHLTAWYLPGNASPLNSGSSGYINEIFSESTFCYTECTVKSIFDIVTSDKIASRVPFTFLQGTSREMHPEFWLCCCYINETRLDCTFSTQSVLSKACRHLRHAGVLHFMLGYQPGTAPPLNSGSVGAM